MSIVPTKEMKELVSILVVDDDAMVRTILIEFLVSFGFKKITEAKNGKHALKLIQSQEEYYDLVISDWEMPEVDGLTLLKAVRNDPKMPTAKFIMVTSQSSQERFKITRAAKSRVDAYMVKPFRGDVLRAKINEVLGWQEDSARSA